MTASGTTVMIEKGDMIVYRRRRWLRFWKWQTTVDRIWEPCAMNADSFTCRIPAGAVTKFLYPVRDVLFEGSLRKSVMGPRWQEPPTARDYREIGKLDCFRYSEFGKQPASPTREASKLFDDIVAKKGLEAYGDGLWMVMFHQKRRERPSDSE